MSSLNSQVSNPTWVLKTCPIEKKIPIIFLKPNCRKLQSDSKNVSLKMGSRGPYFSHLLMRKPLSSGQKWFLRPYFPLIRGMFQLRSGLRFLFRVLLLFLITCVFSFLFLFPEPRQRQDTKRRRRRRCVNVRAISMKVVEASNFIFRPENYVVNSWKPSVSQDDIKQLKAKQ